MINPFAGILENLIAQAEVAIEVHEDDFEKDGLLHCGKCGTPKQTIIRMFDNNRKTKCLCKCEAEKRDREEEEYKQRQEQSRIANLKSRGIQDFAIQSWTFENDDKKNPAMSDRAMKYYKQWEKMYAENIGILLWGNVGTGKTYFAACIANALLEDGVPVLMTNFPKIINALSGFQIEDKNEYVDSLNRYDLLIIDDLGAERQSEFAQEVVFNVIDSRYKSGKPLIVTTNMTLDDLKSPKNITCTRIYDRILEMCVPIRFDGESRRASERQSKMEVARALFE